MCKINYGESIYILNVEEKPITQSDTEMNCFENFSLVLLWFSDICFAGCQVYL